MPVSHTVEQGEYLGMIAARYGFHDPLTVWNDPANRELRERRKNPNVLCPGDQVTIPDLQPGGASASTGRMHAFEAGDTDLLLNLTLEDRSAQPMAQRDGTLTVGGRNRDGKFLKKGPLPETTDGEGAIHLRFVDALGGATMATEGALDLPAVPAAPPADFRLLIGHLDPVDTSSGQRARLNNLGYFAGYTDADRDQLAWATEEFQCDEKLKDRGLSDDRKKNLPTWNHLGRRHGDVLPGEDVS